jgi:hypothetical protein
MNEDKTLFDIVKKLNKHSDDTIAIHALPIVYKQVQQNHLAKIENYNNSPELNRWDKLAYEYNILQAMYTAIANSGAAGRLIKATNYQNEIEAIKRDAAEDYYQDGLSYLEKNTRVGAINGYNSFKRAGQWVQDYKDSKLRMEEAYKKTVVDVLINPIHDNSIFINTNWNSYFNNDYFQQSLVRDLGGTNDVHLPARFYTARDAGYNRLQPDWVVNLTLRAIDIPRPLIYNYSRALSKDIEIGRDTSGNAVYKTVSATMHIQKQSFTASAQMGVEITELATNKNILYNNYVDNYYWEQEVATYSGDSRALSKNDWAIINNTYYLPTRESVLNELYRGIYPQVRNGISNAARW